MIVRIASGITGFDSLTTAGDDLGLGLGGIPENTVTLIYGPPEVGKSNFCHGFAYYGLTQDEPCLYLTTDMGINEISQNFKDMELVLDEYLENKMLYVVDAVSNDDESAPYDWHQSVSVRNPTDILVKVTSGARSISQKNPRLRGVIDSLTTILESNNEMLIVRVLKTYILRLKEAGATAVITYTEGSSDPRTEILIKSMVDNIIRLNGKKITIEAMKGIGRKEAHYQITERGIVIDGNDD
ncbi:MAG: RAD55 family ATPase [Methanobacterium sp.]|jgi:KaiC/GvpD/RAD55 family RecA-like ATPase|uniref:RAD55 family ATPase n=1 Tax=Methanobacterium sp. TaxID=2164 RepID=UPI00258B3ADB|nr:RAD55 family ATPase [Methanobacterium sp.]MCC7559606.1 RAD55 family ATPase [Methanobacterium sp.]